MTDTGLVPEGSVVGAARAWMKAGRSLGVTFATTGVGVMGVPMASMIPAPVCDAWIALCSWSRLGTTCPVTAAVPCGRMVTVTVSVLKGCQIWLNGFTYTSVTV